MALRFPIHFAGVDGVKIERRQNGGPFAVFSAWDEAEPLKRVPWHVVGIFDTVEEALDAAPELCNF